jgi:hypothetical protein
MNPVRAADDPDAGDPARGVEGAFGASIVAMDQGDRVNLAGRSSLRHVFVKKCPDGHAHLVSAGTLVP